MSEHVSVERMNESLDGLLSAAEREPLLRHLDVCADCRNEYARLSETIDAVKTLPRSATPPPEAWESIAARISDAPAPRVEAGEPVEVYRLPTAGGRRAARISLSVPQLAAAAAVVAFFSAVAMWMAMGGGGSEVATGVATTEAATGPAARAVSLEDGRYRDVVDQLERILAEGRGVLATETMVSIEESLLTLNAAIAEIEAALANDPSSDLLLRLLANHQRTKLGVLQRAAAAVQAQT